MHADLGALTIAGGRACSTSTRLTHPAITNETSPATGTGPQAMASLRNLVIGALSRAGPVDLAAALRRHAGDRTGPSPPSGSPRMNRHHDRTTEP